MIMVYSMMIYGIIVGVVGILLLLLLIPMCFGLKDSKKEGVIEENQFDSNEIYYKCLQSIKSSVKRNAMLSQPFVEIFTNIFLIVPGFWNKQIIKHFK